MTPLNRRESFRVAGAWLVAGSLPWWWGCSGDAPSPDGVVAGSGRAYSPLERALQASRASGKPVLAFVPGDSIPSLGWVVAELLAVGGDDLYASLALCEPCFASDVQLRAIVGGEEPLGSAGLLELRGDSWTWRSIRLECPRETERDVRTAAERNAQALREDLAGETQLAKTVAHARSVLPGPWLVEFEAKLARGRSPSDADLLRGAPLALAGRHRGTSSARLAALMRDALHRRPIRGARWARYEGCGWSEVEELQDDSALVRDDLSRLSFGQALLARDELGWPVAGPPPDYTSQLMTLCGIAHVPEVSERFLMVYTQEPGGIETQ
jgi:hypothetical protein